MNFTDPFWGYSLLLRGIVYGLVPAFVVWQIVRLRRALHIFQLEGYKRGRFLAWVADDRVRALFLRTTEAKKPLVMTGRAWRLLIASALLSVVLVLVPPGVAHLYLGGWPADVATWAAMTALAWLGLPYLLVASDFLLVPVQAAINGRYLTRARRRLHEVSPVVVGITGSFGKTSTKMAVSSILGPSALPTPGSFNTPLGVCRTINEQLTPDHRYLVVEMGAYRRGDIAELASFVSPKVGVLTAIGPAHLERFGSLDAIRKAKYELIEALPSGGIAVMNVDDPEVRALADGTDHVRVIRYGIDASGEPDVTATDVSITPRGTRFMLVDPAGERVQVTTQLLGRHAVGHVLAAAAVGASLDIPARDIASRAAAIRPVEHRLQIIEGTGGVTVIDDAYNSNPEGAAGALEVLRDMPGNKKIVVTPGMVELGPLQRESNEVLGRRAAAVADILIVVAQVNRDALLSGARGTADGCEVIAVDTLAEAQQHLGSLLQPGDVVLFENDLPDQYA